jgi:predicted transcriptional regulator
LSATVPVPPVAQPLRERRHLLGISRAALAVASEVSLAQLGRLEDGVIPKRGITLERVLRTLAELEAGPRTERERARISPGPSQHPAPL